MAGSAQRKKQNSLKIKEKTGTVTEHLVGHLTDAENCGISKNLNQVLNLSSFS